MIKEIKRYIVKNILIEKHYKFSLIAQILSLSIVFTIFFFIDRFFKSEIQNYIPKTIDYFSYVFAGLLMFNYSSGNSTIIQIINFDIVSGVFEHIINRKNALKPYLLSLWIYSFLLSTVELAIYISVVCLFDVIEIKINILSLAILITISSAIFSSLAFISSSFIVIFKKGNILLFFISIFESIFAGIYFPTDVLGKFSSISKIIPLSYSISAAQKILYENANILRLEEFHILILFFIILFPLSFQTFRKSIEIAKKLGNLNQY